MNAFVRRTGQNTFAIALVVAFCGCSGGDETRIVAFGDVHGDLEATRSALRLARAIDEEDRWIGGELIVVQTGDQLDRGSDEQAILDLFERLRVEASAAGGAFHALLGNHELMNAKGDLRYVTDEGFTDFKGDLRYVTDEGFTDFTDAVEYDPDDPRLAEFEPHERARMAALLPGGPYAHLLAQRQVILRVGDILFVHGGVLPDHVTYGTYGIDRINRETQAWLRGEADRPGVLQGSDSPQWTRLYSDEPDSDHGSYGAGRGDFQRL
jgi:hypothetical protein